MINIGKHQKYIEIYSKLQNSLMTSYGIMTVYLSITGTTTYCKEGPPPQGVVMGRPQHDLADKARDVAWLAAWGPRRECWLFLSC